MQAPSHTLPTQFETERLLLRSFQPGDGGWYCAASQNNRSHLAQYESDNVAMGIQSEADAETLVRELAAEWRTGRSFFMAGLDKRTNEFVVQIYVGLVNPGLPEYQIGYFVDRDHEGQGFATEAVRAALGIIFEHLKAHRVSLECDDTNARSYRVAERCGMIREGHVRENKKASDGVFSGTLHYGLLRNEFEALRHLEDKNASADL
jgi:aminoglycoside 6'-N-acetyltransferase